jgi:hypothetical protein
MCTGAHESLPIAARADAEQPAVMHAPDIGFFEGIVRDLSSGKGQLRFVIQPLVAIFLGARLGIADAKEGQPPFLIRMLRASHERGMLFRRSISDVVTPMCLAIVIDCILQYYTLGVVRLVPALFVGLLLVWLPYSVSRAITNRLMRRRYAERRAAA